MLEGNRGLKGWAAAYFWGGGKLELELELSGVPEVQVKELSLALRGGSGALNRAAYGRGSGRAIGGPEEVQVNVKE